MIQEEILAGNKLICEFLGVVRWNEIGDPNEYGYYHKQWDWLMPVVEKIAAIDIHIEDEDDRDVFNARQYSVTGTSIGHATINSQWAACVQFITWYNNSIKPTIN
jgi:hypothetical protein